MCLERTVQTGWGEKKLLAERRRQLVHDVTEYPSASTWNPELPLGSRRSSRYWDTFCLSQTGDMCHGTQDLVRTYMKSIYIKIPFILQFFQIEFRLQAD